MILFPQTMCRARTPFYFHFGDPVRLPTLGANDLDYLEQLGCERQCGTEIGCHRFVTVHLIETDNILKILLHLVRGEQASPFPQSTPLWLVLRRVYQDLSYPPSRVQRMAFNKHTFLLLFARCSGSLLNIPRRQMEIQGRRKLKGRWGKLLDVHRVIYCIRASTGCSRSGKWRRRVDNKIENATNPSQRDAEPLTARPKRYEE